MRGRSSKFKVKRSLSFNEDLSIGLVAALLSCLVYGRPSSNSLLPAAGDAPAPKRIAVIAFQAAVTQTNEFQRNFADLQKKYRAQARAAQDPER